MLTPTNRLPIRPYTLDWILGTARVGPPPCQENSQWNVVELLVKAIAHKGLASTLEILV
jgi:hypothetical protein